MEAAPARFTIRPDDYHVPYAGTAGDGRRFFLSEELFDRSTSWGGLFDRSSSWVGLFLWKADGTFDEVKARRVGGSGRRGLPPGQAGAVAGSQEHVDAFLADLGNYVLEPISVEPFLTQVEGVEFGWRFESDDDGSFINIEPGNFICYYAPWDGQEYDT